MADAANTYYKRDFWASENLKYSQPHFRMLKAARLIRDIAGDRQCDLLDVGCGPATLKLLLQENVHYYGIDIAIHEPAPYLLQADLVESPIQFCDRQFDILVAQGFFEYIGDRQDQKLSDLSRLLRTNGTFLVSYVNFDHRNKYIYCPYNNVQSFKSFHGSLSRFFKVRKYIPTSQRWHHDEPKGRIMKAVQMGINVNIPWFTRMFAVEYFFICSPLNS